MSRQKHSEIILPGVQTTLFFDMIDWILFERFESTKWAREGPQMG